MEVALWRVGKLDAFKFAVAVDAQTHCCADPDIFFIVAKERINL